MTITFIARNGPAVLWSWGNYRYTIDVNCVEKVVMNDTDLEEALKQLNSIAESLRETHQKDTTSLV
jgi:hypothetical protein